TIRHPPCPRRINLSLTEGKWLAEHLAPLLLLRLRQERLDLWPHAPCGVLSRRARSHFGRDPWLRGQHGPAKWLRPNRITGSRTNPKVPREREPWSRTGRVNWPTHSTCNCPMMSAHGSTRKSGGRNRHLG